MSETHASTEDRYEPGYYEIRIKGQLEDNGDTLLTGLVVDQAALHGLLKRVRDLGLPLVSVCPVEPGKVDVSDIKS
jgi:hypothetical protein